MLSPQVKIGRRYLAKIGDKEVVLRLERIDIRDSKVKLSARSASTWRTIYTVKNLATGAILKLKNTRSFISEMF